MALHGAQLYGIQPMIPHIDVCVIPQYILQHKALRSLRKLDPKSARRAPDKGLGWKVQPDLLTIS